MKANMAYVYLQWRSLMCHILCQLYPLRNFQTSVSNLKPTTRWHWVEQPTERSHFFIAMWKSAFKNVPLKKYWTMRMKLKVTSRFETSISFASTPMRKNILLSVERTFKKRHCCVTTAAWYTHIWSWGFSKNQPFETPIFGHQIFSPSSPNIIFYISPETLASQFTAP